MGAILAEHGRPDRKPTVQKIAAFGSSYTNRNVGAAEGCDLLILKKTALTGG
jgi:hypothetical protein